MKSKGTLLKLLEKDAQYVNERVNLNSLDGLEITITGASGLVGLNIISAINYYNNNLAKKCININALSFTKPNGIINDIYVENNIKSIYGDLDDCNFIKNVPLSDCIIHSAGYGQPGKFLDNKIKTIAINTSATIGLSKRLKECGRFLFLSSSEVYSGCLNDMNKEDDIGTTTPTHPRSCYIEGKRSGEAIINILRESGINASSARLALAYGPGVKSNDERVLNQFIQKGIDGKITLLDSGESMRTYGYISNVVIMLLNILIKNNKAVYNVGGNSKISIS
jgi:UDP-glucuronate decarboxylase